MNEVKSPKKPLLYYYLLVMLVLLLFNLLAMPWISEHQIKEVDYNTFVSGRGGLFTRLHGGLSGTGTAAGRFEDRA